MTNRAATTSCPTEEMLEPIAAGEQAGEQLTQHIQHCLACQRTIEQLRANNEFLNQFISNKANPAKGPTGAPAFGVNVEGYQILSEIHRGGQGVVYKAVHTATKRMVALKTLLGGVSASSRQLRRFEREIELVAGLHHPYIVTLYDSGVASDGGHYFAMEYVRGVPLDRYLRQSPALIAEGFQQKPIELSLRLFARICEAVQYAHLRGIIHRDLKPDNILIDAAGDPHVLDFGLARALGHDVAGGELARTQTGEFMGTFSYAAPEQVEGDPERVDTRTDVYGLGVILYEMLTGTSPYRTTGSLSDILHNIVDVEPHRPSSVRRKIGGEVDTIVMKCLSKEREDRYQTAGELLRDVHRYLANEPIEAKRNNAWYVLKKTLGRHKLSVVMAASLLALIVVFGVAISFWYLKAVAARQTSQRIIRILAEANREQASKPNVTVFEALDISADIIDAELADDPEFRAEFHDLAGRAYNSRDRHDQATSHLQKALAIRREFHGDHHPKVADSMSALADAFWRQDNFLSAEQLYRTTLNLRKKLYGTKHAKVAENLSYLGTCLRRLGRYDEAEPMFHESLKIWRSLPGDKRIDVALTLLNLANFLRDEGRYDEALRLYEESLAGFRAVHGKDEHHHVHVAKVLGSMGECLLNANRFDEAHSKLDESWRMKRDPLIMETNDVSIANTERNLARYFLWRPPPELQTAETFCRHALERYEKTHGGQRDHHDIGETLHLRGAIRMAQGDPKGAEPDLRRAVDMLQKTLHEGHWQTVEAKLALGECLTKLQRFDEAEAHLKWGCDALRKHRSARYTFTQKAAQHLAELYEAWGKSEQASAYRADPNPCGGGGLPARP